MRASAERVLSLLAAGEIEVLGLIPRASNYTFAVKVADGELETIAVYKPQAGETPLWDFPDGTLYRREVAAHEVSDALGWNVVPPTIVREGPHGVGSLQMFVDAEPGEHYMSLMPSHAGVFRRVAAFDVVINNADRKSGHCLLERETGHVWVIDHGVCFHEQPKLRTVIWDFAGEPLPDEILAGLERVRADAELFERLGALLAPKEIAAMRARVEALIALGRFPDPPEDRRPYPWPPV